VGLAAYEAALPEWQDIFLRWLKDSFVKVASIADEGSL
jgi:hypothetical protein